ncbi:Cytochrome c5 [Bathymodiolus heckerae thiotrophic gill symbiont]|uniref:c-type cytochrome n=1 Tax=Bathymodiolus heckerae thiotrophic gill symbiont TaxID=1052212 RepID=UPI0010B03C9E|nr:c-type cytochrome [Bathymodiolus heckerae thiotrophic gill symbiont]SHN91755.1 Cytochrome c5 [Bathymodiolus heckerae thiotrophic gill symbiont]
MYFKNSVAAIIVIFAIIFGAKTFFSDLVHVGYDDNLTLAERIAPLGQVYLEGDIDVNVIKAPVKTSAKVRSGEEIYTTVCASCHASGVLSAPKFGNKADWAPRVKRGIADLVKVAITGVGAMPPKGTCMNCSDDELTAAIEHMIK